jgi:hypothetical protein
VRAGLQSVEGDLDDEFGTHMDNVFFAADLQLEELRRLQAEDLVRLALERLAHHDEAPRLGIACTQVQVRQPPLATTAPPFHRQNDEIECVHRLQFQPGAAAPARFIRRVQRLRHDALVAGFQLCGHELPRRRRYSGPRVWYLEVLRQQGTQRRQSIDGGPVDQVFTVDVQGVEEER